MVGPLERGSTVSIFLSKQIQLFLGSVCPTVSMQHGEGGVAARITDNKAVHTLPPSRVRVDRGSIAKAAHILYKLHTDRQTNKPIDEPTDRHGKI